METTYIAELAPVAAIDLNPRRAETPRTDRILSAATVFLGAGLLFSVEPMVAKTILPWFGGVASVWTTCMLFFQSVLLLGYLYAHVVSGWRSLQRVAAVHITLLIASLLLLPAIPDARWKPSGGENPVWMILAALGSSVGLPFLLLSSTSPLVQALAARRRQATPYRLFALSNLASLLALLGYPVVVEPFLPVRAQAWIWSLAYGLYVAMISTLIWRSRGRNADRLEMELQPEDIPCRIAPPTRGVRIIWMALAACTSALFLAATTHICQSIAPIPFLWILPLSIYLVSFILCFDGEKWYSRKIFLPLHGAALAGLAYALVPRSGGLDLRVFLPVVAVCLFCMCMYCHGELALRKPAARYLTQYYLLISLGSALGALLVSVAAPLLLAGYFEFPVAVVACALLTLALEYRKSWVMDLLWTAAAIATVTLAGAQIQKYAAGTRVMARNFYGGVRVMDSGGPPDYARRTLIHGAISHGTQFLAPGRRNQPTAYYAPGSGIQLAIDAFRGSPTRAAIIGLGAGTLAAYGRAGDYYRFYELNPLVIDLARREFTFVGDSRATVDLVAGDGRAALEREADPPYDIVVVDAFTGDSIPVHLLSIEAFQLYFRHLKPDGILALHISNESLNLEPVIARAAERFHAQARLFANAGNPRIAQSAASWVLIAPRDGRVLAALKGGRPLNGNPKVQAWTDGYSNLLQIVK